MSMDVPRPPSEDPDVGAEFADLAEVLLSTQSFEAFLSELVEYAGRQTRHGCSVTVRAGDAAPFTMAATDDVTLLLDERQYAGDRGPCLEAVATGIPVVVTDMGRETRWAPYPAEALELGAQSSMSYPLISGERTIGALNFYAFEPWVPDVALQARAAQLADQTAGALAVGLRVAAERAGTALRDALHARSVIDQAIGILVAQQQCSVEDAFALLRTTSQTRKVKLRDVAAEILASAQRRSGRSGRY
jgi:transcriptional regulator with GAF, ATPase, and Fis domain